MVRSGWRSVAHDWFSVWRCLVEHSGFVLVHDLGVWLGSDLFFVFVPSFLSFLGFMFGIRALVRFALRSTYA